jgi:hypothetical protein
MRRDVQQSPSQLMGDQLPPGILPSYERVLQRARQSNPVEDDRQDEE